MVLAFVVLVVAVIASAGIGAIESAIFSLSESRVRALLEERFRGSDALSALRAEPRRLLVLLRTVRIAAAATAATLAGAVGATWGVPGLIAAVVVSIVLAGVISEWLPAGLAANHHVRLALAAAPAIWTVMRRVHRVLAPLERIPGAVVVHGGRADGPGDSEVRQISVLGATEGVLDEQERLLIERAMRLDESKAWDIMTPRVDIFAWRDSLTLDDVAGELQSLPYSRVPVYGETIDDVTGVLYVRDAYQALIAGKNDLPLRALAREPLLVPGSISLTRLLREFQTRRIHMALVVDEYGGTDGLVTLEDVLEELVGEIEDETDIAEEPIQVISGTELVAAGDADIRDINDLLRTSLPHLEHRSLNGYLLEELGRVPQVGERVEREGILIEVLEATETQVLRARLKRFGAAVEPAVAARGAAPTATSRDDTRTNAHTDHAGGDRPPARDVRQTTGMRKDPSTSSPTSTAASARARREAGTSPEES